VVHCLHITLAPTHMSSYILKECKCVWIVNENRRRGCTWCSKFRVMHCPHITLAPTHIVKSHEYWSDLIRHFSRVLVRFRRSTGNHPGLILRFNHYYCLLRRFLDLVVCRHYLSLCQFVAFKIFVHKPIKYDRFSYMNYSL
jgi:hypothetical protein